MISAALPPPEDCGDGFLSAPHLLRKELLHQLFEAQVECRPDQIALEFQRERVTYRELDARANRLARRLVASGIRRGDFVGLLVPRSADLFVAVLAVLKAGAAYVPLDADYPPDRVQYILEDCAAASLISVTALAAKAGAFHGRTVLFDLPEPEGTAVSEEPLLPSETGAKPEDVAYVIYTSGSTGRPKGVQVEHRSVCHLVRAEGEIFKVRPDDRVHQGFSIAFDASVEEVWLAFFAGATLVVGSHEVVHSGPDLSRHLIRSGITVLSTVPTQLSMMPEDVPSLRLLIVGGEACPPDLVERWARPPRRMVNTYGPTEATVIVTCCDLVPGRPVTLGRPIQNCLIRLLDEKLEPVRPGEVGEIHIGGISLARGYVGREDLTRERFIADPEPRTHGGGGRLYRTGDLARRTPDGDLEFLGRVDSQVKIRGHRVELGEIESALRACRGVRAAAASLREDIPGIPQLGAYIVPQPGAATSERELRERIAGRLPAYMLPQFIEVLDGLPVLPSGKLDRSALPPPRPREVSDDSLHVAPRTAMERRLTDLWEMLFAPQRVSIRADFFRDLGGHSLLAARFVSELRREADGRGVSILDLYQNPTIESFAARWEVLRSAAVPGGNSSSPTRPGIPWTRHFLCGLAQFLSLYPILGLFSLQWAAPYLTYVWSYEEGFQRWEAILAAFAVLVGFFPLLLLIAIAVKWLVIGRFRAGEYPLWGLYYFRFWFAKTFLSTVPVSYLAGTPWLNLFYRCMGARIGRHVHLASPCFVCHDLVSIGDDTCIESDTSLTGYHIQQGRLIVGSVRVGARCVVGARSVVRENSRMEDDSSLAPLSLLPAGCTIPAGEAWLGSPARRVETLRPERGGPAPPVSGLARATLAFAQFVGIVLFPACVLAAILPGVVVMNSFIPTHGGYSYLLASPLVALSFVVLLCLEIVLLKWILLGRVRPGRYRIQSFFHLRKWFVDQLLELSLDVLGPLYGSVYLGPWYRLLGARLGRRAEISTASFISPDLLEVGDESFIADSVSLGAPRFANGHFHLDVNRMGTRTFIGNSALLPPGAALGDGVLLGCLSTPPSDPASAVRPNATWLGSPAVFLPRREVQTTFSDESTYRPSFRLKALRAGIEFIRVILPATGYVIVSSLMFSAVLWLRPKSHLWEVLMLFPILYGAVGMAVVFFLVLVKWVLVGRYRPGEHPLWSTFVWRNEIINAVHDHLVSDFIGEVLPGTPFLCWFFRLLGAHIGRRVYLETRDLTEFDLVAIGDEAEINADATLQTHLFEDRIMKMSRVVIGPRCNVGAGALVLYDAVLESRSCLNSLSLLMKGETLPAESSWEGVPARPTPDPSRS